MRRRSILAALIILSAACVISRPAQAQSPCALDIKQALLYLDLGATDKAVLTLEECVQREPGSTDALAWLVLSRAYHDLFSLDKAGLAMERAKMLGVEARLKETPWTAKFFRDFEAHYGALQVIEAPCKTVSFNIALSSAVNADARKMLEASPGWTDNRFRRAPDQWFFLPAGTFRIGDRDVEVVAGKQEKLPMGAIGAVCVASDSDGDEIPDDVDKCPNEAEDRDGIDDADGCLDPDGLPVFWIVAGAAAAAVIGGTTVALIATKKTVYDYTFLME